MKKISIITPFYNKPEFLKDLLSSIAVQTLKDLEVIIINDASEPAATERLHQVIAEFENMFTLRLITNESNQGIAVSRNKGMAIAEGQFVTFIDQDDLLCGNFSLESRVDFLESHPDIDAVGGYSAHVDESRQVLFKAKTDLAASFFDQAARDSHLLPKLYLEYYLQQTNLSSRFLIFMTTGSCLLRADKVLKYAFDPTFDKVDDVEWTLRLFEAQVHFSLLKQVFHFRRVHPQQYHFEIGINLQERMVDRMQASKILL